MRRMSKAIMMKKWKLTDVQAGYPTCVCAAGLKMPSRKSTRFVAEKKTLNAPKNGKSEKR